MTSPPEVEPLLPALTALQRLIERFNSQGLVIGGVAVTFLGKPRMTADVDGDVFILRPVVQVEKCVQPGALDLSVQSLVAAQVAFHRGGHLSMLPIQQRIGQQLRVGGKRIDRGP